MKLLTLFALLLTLPLLAQDFSDSDAQEISLGLVVGAQGDSLVLVDDAKVYIPNLAFARYVDENGNPITNSISYPFTASLVLTGYGSDFSPDAGSAPRTSVSVIKIHQFYDIVDGRLVTRDFE
jgi:hypothetical protein